MLFKKSKKNKAPTYTGEPGMVYSMEPRHGHGQDVTDENGIRQVAGCLPIDPINKRYLLVSSSSNPGSWVIPKGGWEKDETQKQAAMRETWEEAGVKGSITRHIGVFAEKSKSGVKAHHWIYEMEIKEVTKNFPEQKKRDRRWFSYDEAMLVVKAHYIHDALSMSSLSPLVHPNCESLQSGDKKEKKKDKKKKKKLEEAEESEDSEEKKEKKEKKKKEKKEKKASEEEEEEEQVSLVDENGIPLTEEQIEEKKKQKKKEKKQKKKEAKRGEITELTEEEINAKSTPLGTVDVAPPPPLKPNTLSTNEAALSRQMRETYITTPVPNANYNRPPPQQQYNPQQQQQQQHYASPPQQQQQSYASPPQQQYNPLQQQQRYASPPQQQYNPQQQQQRYASPPQQPQFRPMPQEQQYIRPGPPYPHQQPPYPPSQQSYQVRPHPHQFPPAQQYHSPI